MADFKYSEGSVSPSGKYVVQGGKWVPAQASAPVSKLSAQDSKYLNDAKTQARKLQQAAAQLDEFSGYNKNAATGPLYGKLNILGLNVNPFDGLGKGTNLQNMDSIVETLAPQQHVAGSGSTSDLEFRGAHLALPGTDKWGNTNQEIIARIKRQSALAKPYVYFLDRWAQDHGNLEGAEEAFDQMMAQKSGQGSAQPATPSKTKSGATVSNW